MVIRDSFGFGFFFSEKSEVILNGRLFLAVFAEAESCLQRAEVESRSRVASHGFDEMDF